MLECIDITKRFGSVTALDAINLSIPEGRIFGLLGPNGAGKTTLIRIINRIIIPTDGKVVLDGKPVTDLMVRSIGYLPEERGLYRKMKVGEQCIYLARLKGMSTEDAARQLKWWFTRFGIHGWWNRKVEELSKGMAQKIQFITTVLHNPKLIILDEPFSGFDPVNARLVRSEILRLRDEGASIVLSTHNMESVEELCDEIALINKSHLVVCGGTSEIRRRYGEDKVEIIYTDSDGRHTEVVEGQESGNARLRELSSRGATVNSYRELIPGMNDIFIRLVTGQKEAAQ